MVEQGSDGTGLRAFLFFEGIDEIAGGDGSFFPDDGHDLLFGIGDFNWRYMVRVKQGINTDLVDA